MIRSRINLLYMSKEKRRPLVYPSSSQSEGRRTSGSAHGGVTLKKRWKTRSSFCNSVSRTLYVVNKTIKKRNFFEKALTLLPSYSEDMRLGRYLSSH